MLLQKGLSPICRGKGITGRRPEAFAEYQNIELLIREILIEPADHFKIYENGNISVPFQFRDQFHKPAEYIEIRTTSYLRLFCNHLKYQD